MAAALPGVTLFNSQDNPEGGKGPPCLKNVEAGTHVGGQPVSGRVKCSSSP